MKFLNLKSILMACGLLWVGISFYWFTKNLTQDSVTQMADQSLEYANTEFIQKSKDLRFKLAQWSYNYHLVKTKGIDFDQDGFLNSEFEDIYFFKVEDNEFKTQWIKSKDMGSAAVPARINAKLKQWTKEQLLGKEFIYFSEKVNRKGSKVFFGFPINDDQMGEGLILSSLDLDYVQLLNPKLGVYVLDSKGRFISHPNKEYIGQSGSQWIQSLGEKSVFIKTATSNMLSAEFLYQKKVTGIMAQVFMPTLVMFLGLLLVFGVLIFEVYMFTPLNFAQNAEVDSNTRDDVFSKDSYGSILKLDEVRESLNRMSLLSSALKGRIDLAANGELDRKLFEDIKMDFETLEEAIDSTYKSSQNIDENLETQKTKNHINKLLQNKKTETTATTTSTGNVVDFNIDQFTDMDSVSVSKFKEDDSNKPQLGSLQDALSAFKTQGFDEDFDEDSITFEDYKAHLPFDDVKFETSEFDSIEINDEDINFENIIDTNEQQVESGGVVFQEYMGPENETNDWAKIIEELTEEINTVELKPTNFNSDEFMDFDDPKSRKDL